MKRLFKLVAAAVLAAAVLAGCTGGRGGSAADGDGGRIAYPDLLPRYYAGSELAGRVEQVGALVSADGGGSAPTADGVMQGDTVRQAVDDFLAGRTGDLYILSLWGEDRQSGTHFYYDEDGQLTAAAPTELLPDAEAYTAPVYDLELTDYGYLVYREGGPDFEPGSCKLINEQELYPDAARRDELYRTYFAPIAYTALTGAHWDSADDLNLLWLYEDIVHYEGRPDPDGIWPVEDVSATLARYFEGVTREDVVAAARRADTVYAQAYYPDEDAIHYQGGRGGGPICLRITDWTEEAGLLAMRYVSYDYTTGAPNPGTERVLTVELRPDGGFYYRSNLPDGDQAA